MVRLSVGLVLLPLALAIPLDSAFDEVHVEASPSTLSEALAKIEQPREHRVVLHLQPGRYFLSSPLRLGPGHSRLTIVGNQDTIFDGGIAIDGWKAESSWLFSAPAPAAIKSAAQLWVGGERRDPARSSEMIFNSSGTVDPAHFIVTNAGQLAPKYSQPAEMRLVAYQSWTASHHAVNAVFEQNNTIFVNNPIETRWDGGVHGPGGNRYYLENAPEYLTKNSGGFFLNPETRRIYYAPTEAELASFASGAPPSVMAAGIKELISSTNVSEVTFRDVTFQHAAVDWDDCLAGTCAAQSAAFLTSAALHWTLSSHVELHNVTVRRVGGYGVWFDDGVTDSLMDRCTVTDVGAGGVRIGPSAGGVAPAPARNVSVINSRLSDGGHVFREGCGVLMQAAHLCHVDHNAIDTFHYTGVSVGWTWNYVATSNGNNSVSFNLIENIGLSDLSDMGCVYHLGADPGTVINNNMCRNVSSYNYGGWAYYLDQASRWVRVTNNVAVDIKCAGFHQHYGLDNEVSNNIFVDVDAQGYNGAGAIRSSTHDSPGDEGDKSSFTFARNIVYWSKGPLFDGTTKLSFSNETFDDNVYFHSDGDESGVTFPCEDGSSATNCPLSTWRAHGQDVHSVVADPKLDLGSFTLAPDSPALALGFKPIDIKSIGPQ